MSDEEEKGLFIVRWLWPKRDATTIVLCDHCGAERYTSAENLRVARGKKMLVTCTDCYIRLEKEHGVVFGGRVRHGKIVEESEGKN